MALGRQAIEPLFVFRVRRSLAVDDKALAHELSEVVIEGARAESVLSLRLKCCLLDNPVSMQVLIRKSKKNVQCRGGKRRVRRVDLHSRIPTISLSDHLGQICN